MHQYHTTLAAKSFQPCGRVGTVSVHMDNKVRHSEYRADIGNKVFNKLFSGALCKEW